ncbi:iron-containing redox enzyme family protein [Streptomyces sp. NBC_01190]|uniref:iron-containing redox enzyme family protein n=1 Tax=Streptomyces sp. NBC_01190 TaxID=2903767 RepID=UPI00386ED331|nr:iron-containing redox enzyme family protein [Streptomyces sp. NBC_01190]
MAAMTGTAGAASPERSRSEALRRKVGLLMPTVDATSRRMWTHPRNDLVYLEWLKALHGMIRATVPLMLAATESCVARQGDPAADLLGRYLAKHIREEYGHDQWVADDYVVAGGDPEELRSALPGPAIAALVGSQYYWLRHVHPVALIGHIAVLEGNPPGPGLAPDLAARTGLPEDSFRTIARHAQLDVQHRDDVHRLIDRLPLDAAQNELLGLSALHTMRGLIEVMEAILDRVHRDAPVALAG